jgi:putative transcriptional regulator
MITEQQQEQASLYALGALSDAERPAFEAELRGDAELRELVRSLQRSTDLLALASPSVNLPPELLEKVMRRIETATARPHVAQTALSGFHFVAAQDSGGWKELQVRGAWIKLLSLERERGYAVLLGKLEAGVRYPAHTHSGAEEIYVLTGDLHIGDLVLGSGDFHHADAGTTHGVNYSVEGCTLLAVLPADHELAQFAMA